VIGTEINATDPHLATLMASGSPQSVPVWVGREDDHILIRTGEGSLKAKNTRRDPRVALSIVDFHDPYKEAQLRSRVLERRPDGDYTGKPFPFRNPERRVALVIRSMHKTNGRFCSRMLANTRSKTSPERCERATYGSTVLRT
jgi:hypothetical protein